MEFFYKLRRACRLLKVYWNTCDGDWSSIAVLMHHQIKIVRQHIIAHDIIVDAEKVGRQMLIAQTLLDRILSDNYYETADKLFPERSKNWVNHIVIQERQDVNLLTNELRRHLRSWWD